MKRICQAILLLLVSAMLSVTGQTAQTEGNLSEFTEIPDAIIVTYETRLAPYQFSENGQAMGFHVDLMNEMAKYMGVEVYFLPMPNAESCASALAHGEVDLVLGMLPGQAKGMQRYGLSEPISQSTICMMTASQIITQRGLPPTVSYQNGVVSFGFLSSYSNLRTIPADSQIRAFELMTKGKTQAVIGLKDCLEYMRDKKQLQDEYFIMENYMLPIEFHLMARPEDQKFLRQLNNALYQVRISGSYAKLHNKWFGQQNVRRQLLQKVLVVTGIVAGIALLLFIIVVRINLLLKQQVRQKTHQLQQQNSRLEEQILQTNISNEIRNCIVENSPAAIVVFDESCRITMLNKQAQELLFAWDVQSGNSVQEIPLLHTILEDRLQRMLGQGQAVPHWNVTLQSPQNQKTFYQASLYPLLRENQQPGDALHGAILTISDITREILTREQQAEKEKNLALGRMVAGIAHEIRNPLMAIKTYSTLLPEKIANEEFRQKFFEYVPREVDRANTLVTNLIDYAKPRSRQAEHFDVNEVAASCLILIEPSAQSQSVELRLEEQGACFITCDKNQFKQVLINILMNSVEAVIDRMQNEPSLAGNVTLRTRCEEERCIVSVWDNGVGMTSEELTNATEAFFTTKSEGTGLGLALSRQLVEENGGKLLLQSQKHSFTEATLVFERSH